MTLSIRTLPVVEKWECRGCGHCCRGTTVALDEQDLQALQSQAWENHPDFAGVRTVVRSKLLGGRHVLAKREDGRCVFLTDEGRCRIHELYGPAAKPAICRMFPLQVVPLGDFAYLTARRSCPTAAADQGRPLTEQLAELKKSSLIARLAPSRPDPPPIVGRVRRSWRDFLAAADALARLTTDQRLPLVRRLVHGLRFCSLLEQCRVTRVKEEAWAELVQCLETPAGENSGQYFQDRQPPARSTAVLFRLLSVHYLRSHPGFRASGGWRERARMMVAMARFARGKGHVPPVHPSFPSATFQSLERPLGPLAADIAQPLNRFFQTHATSKQYAVVGTRRSLVENFRALAITYPVALWLLRLACGDREPTHQDVVDVVVALERGQGLSALARGATATAGKHELERLTAWYAR